MRFRIFRFPMLIITLSIAFLGCSSSSSSRRVAAKPEPPLIMDNDAPVTVVEGAPATKVTFADRHPMFSRPKQIYDSTNSNMLGKTARATFIGVPSGIFGEVRQIVVGQPQVKTN